ncbi:SGNH hydrolase [Atractiella rhizophila]|nr:SGNH hydrolase [Atractiella rhizophila]
MHILDASDSGTATATRKMDQIVCFGDSITQGSWVAGGTGQTLAVLYQRKLDVMNRGFSGYTTEWALPIAQQTFLPPPSSSAPSIKLAIIWFGANDACLKPSPQHVPLERFKSNLRQISEILLASYQTKLLLVTPPPISASMRAADLASRPIPMALDRTEERTKQFADAVLDVANELGEDVALGVDVWSAIDTKIRQTGRPELYLSDGLHLTVQGYQVVTDTYQKVLLSAWGGSFDWNRLPQIWPHWGDVVSNPEILRPQSGPF